MTKDKRKAAEWVTKAAEQGYAVAQEELAGMHFHGEGVAKEPLYVQMRLHVRTPGRAYRFPGPGHSEWRPAGFC